MSIITPALSKSELDNKRFWELRNKRDKSRSPDLDWEEQYEKDLASAKQEQERKLNLDIDPKGEHGAVNQQIINHIRSELETKHQLVKDPNTSTVRADGGKPSTDLLPPKPLLMIAQALTLGASKYTRTNWLAGMAWSRCYASCLRHLFAWWSGETYDKETGLNHLAHAACNILFLLQYAETSTGTDDRLFNAHIC